MIISNLGNGGFFFAGAGGGSLRLRADDADDAAAFIAGFDPLAPAPRADPLDGATRFDALAGCDRPEPLDG